MTPRNTQQGASASARKAPVRRRAQEAPSARTSNRTITRTPSRKEPTSAARAKHDTSRFRWWLLPVIVGAAIALFVITYYPVARVQYMETRQRAQLQAEFDALQTRNARLGTEVARLKTPEGVEDYARSQLGMVKQGEHVVVVTDGSSQPGMATAANSAVPLIDSSAETTAGPSGPWTAVLDSVFKVQ